ncbi:hypothetical protein [Natrinema versiforme]|uniref:Uncharacterized protein n=1 Tax=Natrinema versiforme TaxID=88724 RepID=A0A4V1FYE9_9EURY|nr:hypothetical protein [Natrinema versiforme]QCS41300.1 hypothetical protein FEJ81_02650 [Natrinema versiforme]
MVSEGSVIDIDCPNGCESEVTVTATAPSETGMKPINLTCSACNARIERCEKCEDWTTPKSGHETVIGDANGVIDVLVCSDC